MLPSPSSQVEGQVFCITQRQTWSFDSDQTILQTLPGVLYNCEYLNFMAFQLCPLLPPGNLKNFNCWRTSFPRYNGSIPQCMRPQFAPRFTSPFSQGGKQLLYWQSMCTHSSSLICATTSAGYSCGIASLSYISTYCISHQLDRQSSAWCVCRFYTYVSLDHNKWDE